MYGQYLFWDCLVIISASFETLLMDVDKVSLGPSSLVGKKGSFAFFLYQKAWFETIKTSLPFTNHELYHNKNSPPLAEQH